MKKITYLLFILSHLLQAQNNPYAALEQRLAVQQTDTVKLRILTELVDLAFRKNLNTALKYAQQGTALSDKSNNKLWQPVFYEMEGRMHSYLLHFDSAKLMLNKSITGYSVIGNDRGQASAALKLSWVQKRSGEKEKAMEADLGALRIMEKLNDQEGIALAYERISDGLSRQDRFKEALDYANKCIDLCEKNNFKTEIVYGWFNMGNVYIAVDSNKQSLEFYHKAVETGRDLKFDPVSLIHSMVGRGNALKHLLRFKEALADYNNALAMAKEINYVNAIAVNIANLGEVNVLLGNYEQALPYQLETVRLQEQSKNLANLAENYMHVSTIYEKLNNFPQALVYQKKALVMTRRVSSVESDTTMSRLLTQYQTEKKEATIAAQQNEILQQQKVQWLSFGVAALLIIVLLIGYRSLRSRNKNNKLLSAKNAENELLLKEIHHRVKNNLEVVSSLLALQSAQISDPNTKEAMLAGQNRVHSIGIVHQKLYQGENLGAIEMRDYFVNLSESILDSFGATGRVDVECAMEKLNVDVDTAVPLGLIVNELLTNTLKYAFPNKQNGAVRIKLEKQKSGTLHLEVSDNGVGKSGVIHGTGFGGQLISLLTRQLNGSMKEVVKDGTHVLFDFKLDVVA